MITLDGAIESPAAFTPPSMRTNLPFLKPKNPRLLVIGGSGRLGGLLRAAWATGAGAAPVTAWQGRRAEDFAAFGGPSLLFDPLGDPAAFAAAARAADVILALAGVVRGDAAALALNTDLARAACDAADAAGGRPVILASSAAVYGAGAGRPCAETDAPAPLAPYGAAKAAMEAALAERPGVTVLRIGNVLGADALFGAPPPGLRWLDILPSGHGPERSFIGPQAFARALSRLVRLLAAGAALPRVINLALPGVVAMDALLEAANEHWLSRRAPEGVIARVELDVARAVGLGLVPEAPASAAALIADLREVPGHTEEDEALRRWREKTNFPIGFDDDLNPFPIEPEAPEEGASAVRGKPDEADK
ncbi:MAG: NAD-dependent epimerase/dehydratase family protein [Paenirhodobacter sp.]|uniref:NAD-dependent epimerase/dehydratase family protein n=1 Tax=Paenirhodobacter sp. TaxID=1965326 RepID=UPI003D123830